MKTGQKFKPGEFKGRKLLTVAHVAYLLMLSERSVWRLASTGGLPKPIKLGGSTRWTTSSIARYLNGQWAPNDQGHETDSAE